LAKAARRGVCDLSTADDYLEKMIGSGLFSPVRSLGKLP